MTSAAGESESFGRLYAELWISFTALMRSYVAAHDIGRATGHSVIDAGKDAGQNGLLTLRCESRILALEFDSVSGTGSWSLYEDDPAAERVLDQGRFRFGDDSRVEFSDRRGRIDLEVAAEAFTAKVFEE
jgi:hypothetical protein